MYILEQTLREFRNGVRVVVSMIVSIAKWRVVSHMCNCVSQFVFCRYTDFGKPFIFAFQCYYFGFDAIRLFVGFNFQLIIIDCGQ